MPSRALPLCRVARIESISIFAAHDAARHDRANATYCEPSLTRCNDAQVFVQTQMCDRVSRCFHMPLFLSSTRCCCCTLRNRIWQPEHNTMYIAGGFMFLCALISQANILTLYIYNLARRGVLFICSLGVCCEQVQSSARGSRCTGPPHQHQAGRAEQASLSQIQVHIFLTRHPSFLPFFLLSFFPSLSTCILQQ